MVQIAPRPRNCISKAVSLVCGVKEPRVGTAPMPMEKIRGYFTESDTPLLVGVQANNGRCEAVFHLGAVVVPGSSDETTIVSQRHHAGAKDGEITLAEFWSQYPDQTTYPRFGLSPRPQFSGKEIAKALLTKR